MDRRVAALIDIGDAAVPALIDAVEKDERLTRSVHFWRDFARSRTVLSVREAALTAVMSILKVRVFEPASTGDNFTARGPQGAAKIAQRLREYWKTYGGLRFDERMMKTLADPKADFEAVREAAHNLGSLGEKRTLTTTVFSDWFGVPAKRPNPAVAKFTSAHCGRSNPCGHGSRLGPPRCRPAGSVVRLRASANRRQLPWPLGRYWATIASRRNSPAVGRRQPRSVCGANLPRPATTWAIPSP